MEHGLAVGMWLVAAALLGFWLWWGGGERQLKFGRQKLPMAAAAIALLITTVIIKSTGALALGVLGVVVLVAARRVGVVVALAVLLIVPPLYIFGRTSAGREATGWLRMKFSKWETEDEAELESLEHRAVQKPMVGWGWWTSEDVINRISNSSNQDRAKSLEFRLINEDRLMERAAQQPWFGWGGWNRAAILVTEDPEQPDKDLVTADGYWIITLANRGWFGLTALYAAMLLPTVRLALRHPWRPGPHVAYAPAVAAAVFVTLYMIDNLSNAMFNPVYVLLAGGLAGWTGEAKGTLPPVRPSMRMNEFAQRTRMSRAGARRLRPVLNRRG
jgi:hypothetical protein